MSRLKEGILPKVWTDTGDAFQRINWMNALYASPCPKPRPSSMYLAIRAFVTRGATTVNALFLSLGVILSDTPWLLLALERLPSDPMRVYPDALARNDEPSPI